MKVQEPDTHPNEPAIAAGTKDARVRARIRQYALPYVLTFMIMFVIWILLSGKFDLFHISLGVVSCGLVSLYGSAMLFPDLNIKKLPLIWLRFIRYIPWLLYQVLLANIYLMYLIFHPRMLDLIDPQIVVFKSRLKSDLALVTLANSITLTPGTITVFVTIFGDITFHAIDTSSGESLPWIMDERIAEIFGQ